MKVEHTTGITHKADRTDMLKSPYKISELITMVKGLKDISRADRFFFATAISMGARNTEICRVKLKDITFYGYHDEDLPKKDIILSNVAKVNIIFGNLKNKKMKYKTGSVIKSEFFIDIVEWIVDRVAEMDPMNLEGYVYGKSRYDSYWLVKKLGNNFFPHYLRHAFVSAMARAGVSPQIVKQACGWRSMDNWNTYAHLNSQDIDVALKKHFGDAIPGAKNGRPLTPQAALGTLAAKAQVAEGFMRTKKNQLTRVSVLNINDKKIAVHLDSNARLVRDRLRNAMTGPVIIKKTQKELDNELLQVV